MKKKSRNIIFPILLIIMLFVLFAIPFPVFADSQDVKPVFLTDENFVQITSGFYSPSILNVQKKIKSPLADYNRTIDTQTINGGDLFWLPSQSDDYSINPKVLMATFISRYGADTVPAGDLLEINREISATLWDYFNQFKNGKTVYSLSGGEEVTVLNGSNAASNAVRAYFAKQVAGQAEVDQLVNTWVGNYRTLFNQSADVNSFSKAEVPNIAPFMQLPFEQPDGDFLKVNSFFDHNRPSVFDDTILRFDGKKVGDASFADCEIGVSCYGGHNGIDYSTGAKRPMLAVASGKVVYKYFNTNSSEGYVDSGLIIDHGNGYMTAYWHMDPITVKYGDEIETGQVLGLSGNIGKSSGAHLHFGLKVTDGAKSVDPYGWWGPGVTDVWGDSKWMWAGDLIADNGEAQMQLFYRNYWTYEASGYGGGSFYTGAVTKTSKMTNWGVWGTYISSPGTYDVYAYWPKHDDNATGVSYRVFSADGVSDVTVNQAQDGDRWVKLGSYNFDQSSYTVILTDFNTGTGKKVYFDAIQWIQVGEAPVQPTSVPATPTATQTSVPTQVFTNTTTPMPTPTMTATPMPTAIQTASSTPTSVVPTTGAELSFGDDIDNPIIIDSSSTASYTTDTRLATSAKDDPVFNCGQYFSGKGVNTLWYQFTPVKSGVWNLSTEGSQYDTVLAVWSGTRGNLSLLKCNDDINYPLSVESKTQLNVTAGNTYFVEVVGWGPESIGVSKLSSSMTP